MERSATATRVSGQCIAYPPGLTLPVSGPSVLGRACGVVSDLQVNESEKGNR
jgi:hypothetical protein